MTVNINSNYYNLSKVYKYIFMLVIKTSKKNQKQKTFWLYKTKQISKKLPLRNKLL